MGVPNLIILVSLVSIAMLNILVSKLDLQPAYSTQARLSIQEILSKMNSTTCMDRGTRLTRMVSLDRLHILIRGYG